MNIFHLVLNTHFVLNCPHELIIGFWNRSSGRSCREWFLEVYECPIWFQYWEWTQKWSRDKSSCILSNGYLWNYMIYSKQQRGLPCSCDIGPAPMAGGYVGAKYTSRLSDRSLKRLIGIVSLIVTFEIFIRVFELYWE